MKPRKVPKELVEKYGDIKPIRGFLDYWITVDKEIISTKNSTPKKLSTWPSNHSARVVELYVDGEANRRSVDELYRNAYGDFKGYPSRIYQNMMDEYEGNEEVIQWVEENVAPLIQRRKSSVEK